MACEQLASGSDSARLDAELLLAHALKVDRSYLFAWPEQQIQPAAKQQFRKLLQQRLDGQPIAYLLGVQEFWSLAFQVGEGVLIPRADTETLVETALELGPQGTATVLDLGTGSGAVACALAHERPLWQLSAVDNSQVALGFAERNVRNLQLSNVSCIESNWFSNLAPQQFDLIVSNPPYIEGDDSHLGRGDLRFEPAVALESGEDGLDAIRAISAAAPNYLCEGAWLMLEHGYQQASAVAALLDLAGLHNISHKCDLSGHQRVTLAQKTSD